MHDISRLSSIAVLGLAFALSAFGPIDGDYKTHAEDAVAKQLSGSPHFDHEFQIVGGREYEVVVCGFVNTTNGDGRYTAPARFAAFRWRSGQWSAALEDLDDWRPAPDQQNRIVKATAFERAYWNRYCTDARHPPMYTATALSP